ncbi:RagB/SusD domain-containing protein [Pseudopedobacter saltans DSM 12145]|uniref:RagB/SusD domain-containing protein n=1 Tax=Pseudopedobacter saltans (strain ATCC 51119 / DSM 12145 / JCM 21818 / CCUG 39354 / LMG 10337 / NBRC 100064 / NCIMB 13643) TaxID=762903 RepID=F0S9Z9_PSESL|nr:RagB/SusD family nutrient uptake outer membrane protein [Pseudopedobacter saltans]ADY52557.1 RagB/SusD domain-containing protein [Pseudopedobacter saltans DSM 12145]
MKRYNLFILGFLFIFTACKNVLETEPETSLSDEGVIVDKRSAQAALVGVYDGLQGTASSTIIAHDLAGDNVVNFNSQNNIVANKNSSGSGGAFSGLYVTINRANHVITKVPALSDELISVADKNQILGEAYFLRGLAYFDLVKTFGGVPIVLEPSTSPNTHFGIKRSTKEQTYNQVLFDLNKAESLLPNTVVRNKVSIFSVYALKARLYLYTEQWGLAEEYATKVIANTNFSLVKPFSNFFKTKNTSESIFELNFSPSDKSSFYTNWLSPAQGGRHDYIPERSFVGELLDPNLGGSRKSLLFQTPQGVYDLILYGNQDGSSSIFILRIAEQYLIRAEARVKKTVPDFLGAVEDLNLIKGRADVSLLTFSNSLQKDDILSAIEKERRYELAFEGHRFIDIVRTGRAAAVFGAVNPNLKDPDFWIFPIPFAEIIKDPELEQNHGY